MPSPGGNPVEVCFLVGLDAEVMWADLDGTPGALKDSRARWEAIWRNRERLVEVAHTHPSGLLAFSSEDSTTMEAVDAALGRRLRYSVVTGEAVLLRDEFENTKVVPVEPWWAELIRQASGMGRSNRE
ncbi:MAG: hypothetical protein WD627_05780 [Actinomycetota bacterium]